MLYKCTWNCAHGQSKSVNGYTNAKCLKETQAMFIITNYWFFPMVEIDYLKSNEVARATVLEILAQEWWQ